LKLIKTTSGEYSQDFYIKGLSCVLWMTSSTSFFAHASLFSQLLIRLLSVFFLLTAKESRG